MNAPAASYRRRDTGVEVSLAELLGVVMASCVDGTGTSSGILGIERERTKEQPTQGGKGDTGKFRIGGEGLWGSQLVSCFAVWSKFCLDVVC